MEQGGGGGGGGRSARSDPHPSLPCFVIRWTPGQSRIVSCGPEVPSLGSWEGDSGSSVPRLWHDPPALTFLSDPPRCPCGCYPTQAHFVILIERVDICRTKAWGWSLDSLHHRVLAWAPASRPSVVLWEHRHNPVSQGSATLVPVPLGGRQP